MLIDVAIINGPEWATIRPGLRLENGECDLD